MIKANWYFVRITSHFRNCEIIVENQHGCSEWWYGGEKEDGGRLRTWIIDHRYITLVVVQFQEWKV